MLYSGTAPIRALVIRIANYPRRLGPSGKPFISVIVLHICMAYIFLPIVKYMSGIMY